MLILGIDDAGRGPVIGPMVLAGCLIDNEVEKELKYSGVKDSKDLTQSRREFLEEKIKSLAKDFEIEVVSPEEIEKTNAEGTKLNELEALKVSNIINKINKSDEKIKVIIDCPSVSISKWTDFLKMNIKNLSNLEINVEHKADQNHVSVAAASILAKCVREREMDKLRKKYGREIGSGYPSDPSTCAFLEKNAMKLKNEGIFRKTWLTYKQACEKIKQRTLF